MPGPWARSAGAGTPGTRSRHRSVSACRAASSGSGLYGNQVVLDEQLPDLDGVQRRPLAELVAAHPEVERVLRAVVFPDAADVAVVLPRAEQRHRIDIARRVVHHLASGELRDELPRLLAGDLLLELGVHRDRVGGEPRP